MGLASKVAGTVEISGVYSCSNGDVYQYNGNDVGVEDMMQRRRHHSGENSYSMDNGMAIMVEVGAGWSGVAGRGSRETGVRSSHWLKLKYVQGGMRTSDENKRTCIWAWSFRAKVQATPLPLI